VTPIPGAGFDVGVAAGILSYFLFSVLVPRPLAESGRKEEALPWLALIAAISLFVKTKLILG